MSRRSRWRNKGTARKKTSTAAEWRPNKFLFSSYMQRMRRRREEFAHVSSCCVFLSTAFVLLLPHCDEDRGDSAAIFFCYHPSRRSAFGVRLLSRVSLILFACITRVSFCCVCDLLSNLARVRGLLSRRCKWRWIRQARRRRDQAEAERENEKNDRNKNEKWNANADEDADDDQLGTCEQGRARQSRTENTQREAREEKRKRARAEKTKQKRKVREFIEWGDEPEGARTYAIVKRAANANTQTSGKNHNRERADEENNTKPSHTHRTPQTK